jgi:hypothetical protein
MLKHIKIAIVSSSVLAYVLALSGCASDHGAKPVEPAPVTSTPVKPAPQASNGNSNQTTEDTTAKKAATVGYRPVIRNGLEYFCKRGVATGSRLRTEENCLTREQLELESEKLDELIRNTQISTEDNRR